MARTKKIGTRPALSILSCILDVAIVQLIMCCFQSVQCETAIDILKKYRIASQTALSDEDILYSKRPTYIYFRPVWVYRLEAVGRLEAVCRCLGVLALQKRNVLIVQTKSFKQLG